MSASDKITALLTSIGNIDTNETKESKNDESNTYCMKWNKDYIENIDTFIFDCDGVVWLSSTPIPGAKEILHRLMTLNKRLIFLSNNSTKDIKMYISKFRKLFDLKVESDQIFTSATATASYLTFIMPQIKQHLKEVKILLIGSQGLYNILQNEIDAQKHENVSILWTRKDIPNLETMTVSDLTNMELDPKVGVIIAGWDHFYGYNDISIACRYLHEMKHEVQLVGTNDDKQFPAKAGVLLAGTGSLLASIKAVSPLEMKICGKPHTILFDMIKQRYPQIDVNKCLMVGDRIQTDIVFGINSGMKTALVMTGITTPDILEKSEIKPTFVMPSVQDLL